VAGLRAAYEAEAPGIVWHGVGDQGDKGRLLAAFAEAFPGARLKWIDPKRDYDELLVAMSAEGGWIACRAQAESHVRRFRWAMAEEGRRGHAIIVTDGYPCPEWWPVHGRLMAFPEARRVLETAGALRPGAMAALVGLEPEAVEEIVRRMLFFGWSTDEIVQALPFAFSPGIVWARFIPEVEPSAKRGGGIFLASRVAADPDADTIDEQSAEDDDGSVDELKIVERALHRSDAYNEYLARVARALGELDIADRWDGTRHPSRRTGGDKHRLSKEEERELSEMFPLWAALVERTHRAIRLVDEGNFAEAIRVLEEQRDEIGALDSEHPTTRRAVRTVAWALVEQGSHKAALQRVAGALALEGRLLGVDRASFTSLLPLLARIFTQTGHTVDAEALLHKLLGPDGPEPLPGGTEPEPASHALASVGNPEADECLQLFLALPQTPPLSAELCIEALRLLAEAWITQSRYDEAERVIERAVHQADAMLPPDHAERRRTLTTHGRALFFQARPDQAEATLRRALSLAEKHAGPHHPDTGRILAELARVEHRLGRPEAPVTAKRALAILEVAQITDTEKQLARGDLAPIAAAAP
jgi:tetratricopeptide (TPR) repeat protein